MPDLASLSIQVEAQWRPAEPDYGATCKGCDEAIYGEHFQLFVRIANNEPEKVDGYRLCPGCEQELNACRRAREDEDDERPPYDRYTPD